MGMSSWIYFGGGWWKTPWNKKLVQGKEKEANRGEKIFIPFMPQYCPQMAAVGEGKKMDNHTDIKTNFKGLQYFLKIYKA